MFVDINKLLTYTFQNYKSKLEKSFYDIRYSSSKSIINKYLSNGVLSMTSSGKLWKSTKVSKKEFINTTNKILKYSYTISSSENKITLLEVANLFKDFHSKSYSTSVKNKYKNTLGHLSSSDFNKMVHLYELNVLPKDYKYNTNASISREEMILILDAMSYKVKTFKKFTVNSVKSTSRSISGYGEKGASIKAYVNGKQIGKTATVDSKGAYKLTIPKQKSGFKVSVKMSKSGYTTSEKTITVKKVFTSFTVNSIKKTSTNISGKGLKGSTVKAYVNGKQIGKTVIVDSKGAYKLTIPKQKSGRKVVVKISKSGYATSEKTITVK